MMPMVTTANEAATPVRPSQELENSLKNLPGQSRPVSNSISRRARKRNSNQAIPWLFIFGILTGVTVLVSVMYLLLLI
jgi:hypothetical protein|tara:strand:+ start:402 stop:635 length:234 start_codon:yes stop_codon:yes gene_type:complete